MNMHINSQTVTTACLVADRNHLNQAANCCRELGGSWHALLNAWAVTSYPYVVLLAHEPRRIERGTPLMMPIASEAGLRRAVSFSCSLLNDVHCAWVLLIDEPCKGIVQEETLRDTVTAGNA